MFIISFQNYLGDWVGILKFETREEAQKFLVNNFSYNLFKKGFIKIEEDC